ncbi:RNA polymerase sigma factor [Micromonospora sp. BRA006-A]|nr:RNA polymerase sigma factor [Micromonospora sp. BRA006-A]
MKRTDGGGCPGRRRPRHPRTRRRPGGVRRLVARHTASAYRTAVLLGAGPDAEDVVQEAFVKAYRKLSRYRAEASFRSWLLAIVANETRTCTGPGPGATG